MSNLKPFFEKWASQYLSQSEMRQAPPEKIGRAMKRMFRMAAHQDIEVGPAFQLTRLIREQPDRPLWALCGTVCRFYADVLMTYGYSVELISLWFSSKPNQHAGHVAVRFAGPGYPDFAFFDPLYGAALVDKNQKWVGLKEIMLNLDTGAPELDMLELEPYVPSKSGYENVNNHDYSSVFPKFFNAIVTRDLSSQRMVVHIRDSQKCHPLAVREYFRKEGKDVTVFVQF